MRNCIKTAAAQLFGNHIVRTAFYGLFAKFLLFDFLWCVQTTFTSLSKPALYINTLAVTFLLLFPLIALKKKNIQVALMLLLDALLIANLMYNRTYNAPIPLDSYALASNLSDFSASVIDQMRWYDTFLPLETLFVGYCLWKEKRMQKWKIFKSYAAFTLFFLSISMGIVWAKGGIVHAVERLQNKNDYTCVTPIYTIAGYLTYDAIRSTAQYTPEIRQEINEWMHKHPKYTSIQLEKHQKKNLIIVFCESLESWVIGKSIEGKPITPYLNKALKDPSTLYAPHVLTQVRGGRSIDAQLMLNAGLLPVKCGCYAFKYPNNTFFTLAKAMKQQNHTTNYLLTVDRPIIWNQGNVARLFGFDKIYAKKDWKATQTTGPKKNLADVPFIEQAIEKMRHGEIWKRGEHVFLQMVTYSGHSPFILPDQLKRIHLKGNYPEKMADYIITANYTDFALGKLLAYLKTRPDYSETMVVIVGDHEGLASDRAAICASKEGKGMVSEKQFVPFIVINSPKAMHTTLPIGQIDIYPTLLNLLQLDDYPWKGVGQSLFSKKRIDAAVGSSFDIEVGQKNITKTQINHLKKAYDISDLILSYDVFAQSAKQ